MPGSILTDVAPVTFHSSVVVPPGFIEDGLALKDMITGGTVGVGWLSEQPATRTNSNASERKTNLFILLTPGSMAGNIAPALLFLFTTALNFSYTYIS
jgi:hypothetical protein